jgi:hypothetical protein
MEEIVKETISSFDETHEKKSNELLSPVDYKPVNELSSDISQVFDNKKIISRLKRIGEKSIGYKWLHTEELHYYAIKYKFLWLIKITIFILLTSITSGNIIILIINNYKGNLALGIIEIVLLALQGFVEGIIKKGQYEKNVYKHKITANKYHDLYLDIQTILSIPINEKNKIDKYLIKKTKQYSNAYNNAPIIRTQTMKKYIKSTADIHIAKPLTLGIHDDIIHHEIINFC